MKKKSIAILLGIVMIFAGLMVLSSIEKAQASPVQLVSSQPEFEWSKTYGGSGRDTAYSVIQTRDGGYALAGITYSYGAGNGDFWLVKLGYK